MKVSNYMHLCSLKFQQTNIDTVGPQLFWPRQLYYLIDVQLILYCTKRLKQLTLLGQYEYAVFSTTL